MFCQRNDVYLMFLVSFIFSSTNNPEENHCTSGFDHAFFLENRQIFTDLPCFYGVFMNKCKIIS